MKMKKYFVIILIMECPFSGCPRCYFQEKCRRNCACSNIYLMKKEKDGSCNESHNNEETKGQVDSDNELSPNFSMLSFIALPTLKTFK